ncbi:hypothetical protein [Streptomyces sp. NPDC059850]|uniref:hypothetical protein n=1 Tax=Streptomyces sp. NPDC059850 TaxID=3346970 RepID=UPI0036571013
MPGASMVAVVCADEQQVRHADELVVGERRLGVGVDELGQQVVGGGAALLPHLSVQEPPQFVECGRAVLDRDLQVDQLVGPHVELFAIVVGDPEQFADRQGRHRHGEIPHEIGGGAAREHLVDPRGDDFADPQFQPPHPRKGKVPGQRVAHPVGAQSRAAEQPAAFVVPGDQPADAAVGQVDPLHLGLLAVLLEHGGRIERARWSFSAGLALRPPSTGVSSAAGRCRDSR